MLQCVPPLILTVKINNIPKYQRAEAEKDETEIHHRRHLDVRNRFQHFRKEDDKNHQDHLEHLKGNAADSCMVVVEKDKGKSCPDKEKHAKDKNGEREPAQAHNLLFIFHNSAQDR